MTYWMIEISGWLLSLSALDFLIVIPHTGWLHAAIEENIFTFVLSLCLPSALVVRLLTNRFIWEYDPTLGKNTSTLRALVFCGGSQGPLPLWTIVAYTLGNSWIWWWKQWKQEIWCSTEKAFVDFPYRTLIILCLLFHLHFNKPNTKKHLI